MCSSLVVLFGFPTVLLARVDYVFVRVSGRALGPRAQLGDCFACASGARDPAVEHGCLGVPSGVCQSDLPVHTHSILARSFRWR